MAERASHLASLPPSIVRASILYQLQRPDLSRANRFSPFSAELNSSMATNCLESNVISTPFVSLQSEVNRVIIIYRHSLLRDMYTRLFAEAGISVVAAIPSCELTALSLVGINSDVIVSDEASAATIGLIAQAILFRPPRARVSRLIAVGAGQMISVDFKNEVVNDASIEDLISRAQLRIGAAMAWTASHHSSNGHETP
jgi:hypothetical protein